MACASTRFQASFWLRRRIHDMQYSADRGRAACLHDGDNDGHDDAGGWTWNRCK
jgi:hypothetical protein